jgi:hypothetical protein
MLAAIRGGWGAVLRAQGCAPFRNSERSVQGYDPQQLTCSCHAPVPSPLMRAAQRAHIIGAASSMRAQKLCPSMDGWRMISAVASCNAVPVGRTLG